MSKFSAESVVSYKRVEVSPYNSTDHSSVFFTLFDGSSTDQIDQVQISQAKAREMAQFILDNTKETQ